MTALTETVLVHDRIISWLTTFDRREATGLKGPKAKIVVRCRRLGVSAGSGRAVEAATARSSRQLGAEGMKVVRQLQDTISLWWWLSWLLGLGEWGSDSESKMSRWCASLQFMVGWLVAVWWFPVRSGLEPSIHASMAVSQKKKLSFLNYSTGCNLPISYTVSWTFPTPVLQNFRTCALCCVQELWYVSGNVKDNWAEASYIYGWESQLVVIPLSTSDYIIPYSELPRSWQPTHVHV